MSLIEENEVNKMDNEAIQQIHQQEFNLLNTIDELSNKYKEDPSVKDSLEATLDEYIAHVINHFKVEEDLMKEHSVPTLMIHKLQHDKELNALQVAALHWKKNDDIDGIINYIRTTKEWLVEHVNTMDTYTANYIEENS